MNDRDTVAAAIALAAWFENQGISPQDAVPVMIRALSSICTAHVRETGGDADYLKRGLDIIATMIRDAD